MAQKWQARQRPKVVQKGPKGPKMVNLSVIDHLGPFWAHLDPFGPFQTKIILLPQMDNAIITDFCYKRKNNNIPMISTTAGRALLTTL